MVDNLFWKSSYRIRTAKIAASQKIVADHIDKLQF
jgi:hypothetical protein